MSEFPNCVSDCVLGFESSSASVAQQVLCSLQVIDVLHPGRANVSKVNFQDLSPIPNE